MELYWSAHTFSLKCQTTPFQNQTIGKNFFFSLASMVKLLNVTIQKCLMKRRALWTREQRKNVKILGLISCLFCHNLHKIVGRKELQKGRDCSVIDFYNNFRDNSFNWSLNFISVSWLGKLTCGKYQCVAGQLFLLKNTFHSWWLHPEKLSR